MPIDRDEFHTAMAILRDDIKSVAAKLDLINGRTRAAETEIAVLKARWSGGAGAAWGGGIGTALVAAAEAIKWLWHR